MCTVEAEKTTVYLNQGAIVPLGELMSSEDVAPKTFNSYTSGDTYTSGPIKYVKYSLANDPSKVIVGYEVSFVACAVDAFTLYIRGQDEEGAFEALEYVFDTMKVSSNCNL